MDSDRGSINDRQDMLNQTGRSGSAEPAGSSRGMGKARPKAEVKQDKKKKMKQDPAAVASVQFFQTIAIYLNAFTVFCTVIFL